MNKLEYYNRQQESWSEKELEDIKDEYTIKGLTISQIADIHRRTPGSISYKLKALELITTNKLARGYTEYIASDLYKEIIETSNKSKADKSSKPKKVKVPSKTVSDEIKELKEDIKYIKTDIKEILRFIKEIQ